MNIDQLEKIIERVSKQDLPINTDIEFDPIEMEYDEEFLMVEEDQYWRYVTMLGQTFSGETRKKMSESHKKKKLSDEHKKRIGDAHRGKMYNEETRKKMSEAHKGKKPVVTDEMKEKLRVANTGKILSEEHKAKIAEGMRKARERKRQQRELGNRGS